MTLDRRKLLSTGLAAGAVLVGRRAVAAPATPAAAAPTPPAPGAPSGTPRPGRVVVPDGSLLPWTSREGVKVFHLRAEPITHQIAPGLTIETWGYNGATPGPVIEATEGDRVRVYVTNRLPEVTTVHWHGILVPHGMDGVAGLTQRAIAPGKTFRYDFTFDRAGTFMYHPHADEMTQIALGMVGMIVVHPRGAPPARRIRDYALMLHEWKIPIGTRRPDPLAMNDFNQLAFNGKAFPATTPLVAETGDLVRIRIGNLGPMDHHPIHLHGHHFQVVATDGGTIPPAARYPETTVLVPVGATRTIEFVARPGDWAMHCHMTHHVMNQMGHDVAPLIGADVTGLDARLGRVAPGYMTMGASGMAEMSEMQMAQPTNSISMVGGKGAHGAIDMGGMFTIVKVRDRLGAGDPGWYAAPPNTTAIEATPDDLRRDGITP